MGEYDPYKESKRERRIRNRLRMISRGRTQYRHDHPNNTYYWLPDQHFLEHAEMHGRKFHDNLCLCSCDVCGNVRRSGWSSGRQGLTIQERRAISNDNEYFEELGLTGQRRKP